MICLFESKLKKFFVGTLLALLLTGLWQLLCPVSAHAQVRCDSTQKVKLNTLPGGVRGLGTNCFIVSIPPFTASVEVEFAVGSSENRYDVYWQDTSSDYAFVAGDLDQTNDHLLPMPHITKNSERPHTLAVVPRLPHALQIYSLRIYAKGANGNLQYEQVGAHSGTSSISGEPMLVGTVHQVPAKSSIRTQFTARCGAIDITANWPKDRDNLRFYRVNLYAPNNQRVHSVPVGRQQELGNVFGLRYLISPNQVAVDDQWTVELVNNNRRTARVLLNISTNNDTCPVLPQQASQFDPRQKQLQQPTTASLSTNDAALAQTRRVTFQQGQSPSSTYNGASDVSLEQTMPDTNQANVPECYVDGDDPPQSNLSRVTLLKWAIDSIPRGSVVQSAWITLQVTNRTGHTYYVYGMRRDWAEEQATWQQAFNGAYWIREGALSDGDHDPMVVGSIGPVEVGTQFIHLNANGLALVQGWIDGIIPNYGLRIANSVATDGVDFYCGEATDTTLRPALTIEYIGN